MRSRRKTHLASFLLSALVVPGLSAFFGSCANYNSNTFDSTAYLGLIEDPSDPRFAGAFRIIQYKCSWCHYHQGQYPSLVTSRKWVESRQVVAQSANASPLFLELKNPSGGGGDMPKDLPPLSSDEYTTIQNWINGINPGVQ